jgi:predicted small secreted protein
MSRKNRLPVESQRRPNPSEERNQTGRTIWDIVWEIISRKWILITILTVLVVSLITLIWVGLLNISFGNEGFKVNFGQRTRSNTDLQISGSWVGTAKDSEDKDGKFRAQYTYEANISFVQNGDEIEMNGSYRISNRPNENIPIRRVAGKGVMQGEYLKLLYDIRTEQSPGGVGYGVMLLRFHPSGTKAEGHFMARSMKDDGMIFGEIVLYR